MVLASGARALSLGVLSLGALSLSVPGCGSGEERPAETPAYARPQGVGYTSQGATEEAPQVRFTDVTAASGLRFEHESGAAGERWMPETMGSGAAFLDYDGDGDDDALLINGAPWPGDRGEGPAPTSALFANRGDGTFAEVTKAAGLDVVAQGMGVAAADYDADGDTDVYLTALGDNLLLRNGEGRFRNVAGDAGVAGSRWTDDGGRTYGEWSTGAVWTDVDGDGWVDLFVAHYVRWSPETDLFFSFDGTNKSYATPQQYPGSTPRLYHNLGNGRFEEITSSAGLYLPEAKSLGVGVADFDEDGAPDLVVTNDTQPNFLLHNLGDGRFEEIGLAVGIGYDETGRARAGMGVDVANLSDDGGLTIGIGNFSREALSLYRQQGPGGRVFVDGAGKGRLVQPTLKSLTFGLRFLDYDLDGHLDLAIANGHIEPGISGVQREITYAQPPQLFWNDGTGRFVDVSERLGEAFARPVVGRGLAASDVDGDGDQDLLITVNGGTARLFRNEAVGADGATGRSSLTLRLEGAAPNRDALGAVVTVVVGGRAQRATVRTGSSYLSQSSLALVFGLDGAPGADRVSVRWPDGSEESLAEGLAAGFAYRVTQGRGVVERRRLAQ